MTIKTVNELVERINTFRLDITLFNTEDLHEKETFHFRDLNDGIYPDDIDKWYEDNNSELTKALKKYGDLEIDDFEIYPGEIKIYYIKENDNDKQVLQTGRCAEKWGRT